MTWNHSRALLGKKRESDFRRGGNMSDFYQSGVVATLHRLGRANGHKIESELEAFSKQRPLRWCSRRCIASLRRSAGNHSRTPLRELPS